MLRKRKLDAIASYCDRLLKTGQFTDWPGAANGLQVENDGAVSKIAAAVDASAATIRRAIAINADLLVVHHGLFWGATHPWTGKRYELLRLLLDNNLAVYSSHLPLDAHPRIGNNALLAREIGLRQLKPFFFEKGQYIGLKSSSQIRREV